MASAVVQPPHQYASSHASSSLPPSLITTRPILPLPKRRGRSLTLSSSSAITSNSAPRLLPPQIFSHTCPPATNQSTPPYVQTQGDYESSDSDEEGDDAGSTASSIGREDFNLKNKKKRKIPLSATASANVGVAVTDIGTPVNGNRIGGPWKGRLSGWRVPSATSRTEGGYLRRKARAISRTYCDDEPENATSQRKNEEATENKGSESSGPAPSGPFSFTCASPLTLPIVPTAPSGVQGNQDNTSAPPNAPLPVPPPPPPPIVQEHTPQQQYVQQGQPQPQQPQPTQTGSQQPPPQQRLPPQGIKHPNSEKARRVAQLTKLRERYRTGPKPDSVLPFSMMSSGPADPRTKSTFVNFVRTGSFTVNSLHIL